MSIYSVAKAIVRPFSYLFFPIRVHGDRNSMPSDGGVILCANHISFMDVVMLALVFRRKICFVGKDKYAQKPVLKTLFKWFGAFGINTEKPDLWAIKKCISVPASGEVLGIFPEGTRILKGKVSNPMPGVMMIAGKSKSPLFYVRIKPRRGKFRLFVPTDVYIGGIVTPQELGIETGSGAEYKAASANLMKKIYCLGE